MEMLIGEYRNTLDEKGRILFPTKLRTVLQQNVLIVTQGLDTCLMLFTLEEWRSLTNKIIGRASIFDDRKRLIMRRFIAPATEIEFDKSGRLSIPQTLRDRAHLKLGSECVIFAMDRYMELWDAAEYGQFDEEKMPEVHEAIESLRDILL